ncbi:MAG: aldehyde dehydrogenase [Rhodospirillaceae bacterium]|jgi:thiamine pyrophosphate-dependent acetolactate synthase large subunit-like protein|nr:aldehyde dehydrogenase [Rhodospirillaceae bacterium]MBT4774051.1 aldehyde dehydrogenase [Rhodospirillaceae bacterium]MBT5358614.1 aldehyde dehydrogenase [Rhodospirillaceae bacterium]MBT5768764.1 aldehyde dehydrogenase [Rhodospirillaceae bacterium]MBT6311537.1 aldehyde dehydrogenase [Rhodospirillaceae bacterium]
MADPGTQDLRLDRREAVARLLQDRGELLVVSGLGSATYDCAAAGDDPRNFYLWGAMGGTAALALGLAQAQPNRPVAAITGDGDMLMGLGSLATIAAAAPANLSVIVLDNEVYGETGAQPTATARGVSLVEVARGCGIDALEDIRDMNALGTLAARMQRCEGPLFANIKIAAGEHPRVLPARDGAYLRSRFREAVLGTGP